MLYVQMSRHDQNSNVYSAMYFQITFTYYIQRYLTG